MSKFVLTKYIPEIPSRSLDSDQIIIDSFTRRGSKK